MAKSRSSVKTALLGQGIEQGRFAGIGVADDGDDRHAGFDPFLTALVAAEGELLQLPFQPGDPVADAPSVDLQLGLTRTAPADSPHQARHLHSLPVRRGRRYLQLGQFHLHLAVQALGAPGEDVEDQLAPVDDLQFGHGGDGADLGRGQFLVEDQQGRAELQGADHHLPHLPFPHQVARVELPGALDHRVEHLHPGGPGQFLQFLDGVVGLFARRLGHRDQDSPFLAAVHLFGSR